MKKMFLPILMLIAALPTPSLQPRGEGAAVAGAFGGLALGTMIGSAAAQSSRNDRATQEAIKAQDKTDQLRIEQERQRVAQIERDADRRGLERKIEEQRKIIEQQQHQSSSSTLIIALSILASILLVAVGGLLIVLFKR